MDATLTISRISDRKNVFAVAMALCLLFAVTPAIAADASPSALLRHGMLVGVDYYPEHWPEERWETDLQLMEDANFNVVRLAEFSWARLEPREGEFDFA